LEQGGTECGTVGAQEAPGGAPDDPADTPDPGLRSVAAAWPHLGEADRRAILGIVRAASQKA
jgi:hypothetical protein